MRRLIPISVLAALAAAAVFAVSASAQTVILINVDVVQTHGREVRGHFIQAGPIVPPGASRHDVVGHWRLRCGDHGCRGGFDFDGAGRDGIVRVKGSFSPEDNKITVTGGTEQFNGVGGKVLIHDRPGPRAYLKFIMVR